MDYDHGKMFPPRKLDLQLTYYRLKIYQLYDTSRPESQWVNEAIRIFNEYGLNVPPPRRNFQPEEEENVVGNLFGFHPWDNSEAPDDSFKCGICQNTFEGGESHDNSYAMLHCKESHVFHLGCILSYWDREGKCKRKSLIFGASPIRSSNMFHLLVSSERF